MVGKRFCSVCRRWLSRRLPGWRIDKWGAWVCPECREDRPG